MEDKSSRTSIIVAIVAIILIVGGIFLLNQSISGQQSQEEPEEEVVVVVEEEEPDPTNFEECRDLGGFVTPGPPQECTLNGSTFVQATNVSNSTEDAEEVTTPEENTDTTDDQNPEDQPEDTELTSNQFTAELTSISGNQSSYKIVQSGFPDARWIVPGAPMNLVGISSSFNVDLEVGNIYEFTANITESDGGFQINSIDSVILVS